LAKYPIKATDANLKNCLYGGSFDSEKTKYLVIKKLTSTPMKKEIENESV
jgi:hypothetical protein